MGHRHYYDSNPDLDSEMAEKLENGIGHEVQREDEDFDSDLDLRTVYSERDLKFDYGDNGEEDEDSEHSKLLRLRSSARPRSGTRTGRSKPSSQLVCIVAIIVIGLAALLVGGIILLDRQFLSKSPYSQTTKSGITPVISHGHNPNVNNLMSNGTHEFKKTVLLISLDGVRADYLDRGLTPHLLGFNEKGIRAEYMKPIFPTVTFPNHWTILTGLYAESHGIIANDFWDTRLQLKFDITKFTTTFVPDFYDGEPIWETTSKAGLISANLMWPGPIHTKSGAAPDYFVRMRVYKTIPHFTRL